MRNNNRTKAIFYCNSGNKYWGPVSVVSNSGEPPAFMAQEDFTADSIVDIKPYVPYNWHPDFQFLTFITGKDSSGFVFDSSSSTHDLVYRHKPGLDVSAKCRLIPQTNLAPRDYSFSGTLVKTNDNVMDTMGVGVFVYDNGKGGGYQLYFKSNGIYFGGGRYYSDTLLSDTVFKKNQSVDFELISETDSSGLINDSITNITVKLTKGAWEKTFPPLTDNSVYRIKEGYPGVGVILNSVSNYSGRILPAIRYRALSVRKSK